MNTKICICLLFISIESLCSTTVEDSENKELTRRPRSPTLFRKKHLGHFGGHPQQSYYIAQPVHKPIASATHAQAGSSAGSSGHNSQSQSQAQSQSASFGFGPFSATFSQSQAQSQAQATGGGIGLFDY